MKSFTRSQSESLRKYSIKSLLLPLWVQGTQWWTGNRCIISVLSLIKPKCPHSADTEASVESCLRSRDESKNKTRSCRHFKVCPVSVITSWLLLRTENMKILTFLLQNVKYQSCRTCRTGSATVPQSFTHSLQFFQESHSTGSVTSHPPQTTRERRGDGGETGGDDDPAVQRGSVFCNGTTCCSPSPVLWESNKHIHSVRRVPGVKAAGWCSWETSAHNNTLYNLRLIVVVLQSGCTTGTFRGPAESAASSMVLKE